MAYWWQRYANTPDANTSTPPDGAPEDHFPDQVNNIQRQAMAAVNEIGSLVLGPGDGTSEPQSKPNAVNNDFLKLIYDALLPINTIQGWDSNGGVDAFPVPAGSAFASVVWELCDSTGSAGTPDFQDVVIAGANSLVGPNQKFTGDLTAAGNTGDGGAEVDLEVTVGGHKLAKDELPKHAHLITDVEHDHSYDKSNENVNGNPAGGDLNDGTSSTETTSSFTGITVTEDLVTLENEHTHANSKVTTSDHDHLTGQPAVVALELYKRVA